MTSTTALQLFADNWLGFGLIGVGLAVLYETTLILWEKYRGKKKEETK